MYYVNMYYYIIYVVLVKWNAYELVFCATLQFSLGADALLSVTGSMLTWCNFLLFLINLLYQEHI